MRALSASGGTEMAPALMAALAGAPPQGYLRQVVFLTDGAVGNEAALFRLIDERLGAGLFTIGIGTAPNSYFMQEAAETGRGTFTYIGELHEVGDRMASLLAKLEHPVLTDIRVDWPSATAAEVSMSVLADLYARRRQRQDSSPSGPDTSTARRCPTSPGRASSRGIAIPISVSWHVSRLATSSMSRITRRRAPFPCDGDRSRGCAKGPH